MSRAEALQKVGVGTYGTEGDQLDWTYYDEFLLDSTVLTHRLFTTPLGTGGKTLDQTNLPLAGQIPQGQLLDVRAIKMTYTTMEQRTGAELQMIYTVLTRSTCSIKLQNKETMGQWCMQELFGTSTLIALAEGTVTQVGQIQPRYHSIFPLNKKIILAALTPFEVTVIHHAAPNILLDDDRIKFYLSGILTRVT